MPQPPPGLHYELRFADEGYVLVAGLDEAGRGALAGPVAAGAAILPASNPELTEQLDGVRDSKTCTPREREILYGRIRQVALASAVGMADAQEIDALGIAPATRLAMRRAIESLAIQPQALLTDWVRLPYLDLPQRNLVRGESESLSIAAASILAKVARDRLLVEFDGQYPAYGFARHKGYGTPEHRAALAELGPCAIHRRSFAPLRVPLLELESLDEDRAGA